jgi:hypothetical protein
MEQKIDMVPIEGFDGYLINGDGRVFSKMRKGVQPMTPVRHVSGVWEVQLMKNKRRHIMAIHRLVALAFIPNPKGYHYVVFLDGNKENCHVDNLQWSSIPKYYADEVNSRWRECPDIPGLFLTRDGLIRYRNERLKPQDHKDGNARVMVPGHGLKAVAILMAKTFMVKSGKKQPRKILTEEQVAYIKASYQPRVVTLKSLAEKYSVAITTIRDIVTGRSWESVEPEFGKPVKDKFTTSDPKHGFELLSKGETVKFPMDKAKVLNKFLSIIKMNIKEQNLDIQYVENFLLLRIKK